MMTYPMLFKVTAEASSGIQTTWSTQSGSYSQKALMAIPPEFSGPGGGFSPEDLYAMALANCFVATFKVFAEKSRLSFSELKVQTTLSVDRNEKGQPWMAKAGLNIELSGVAQKATAQRLLEKTSQSCMILNSVLTEKSFEFRVLALNE